MYLTGEIYQGVDTLMNKMELIWFSLTVEIFKIKDPLEEKIACSNQLFFQDHILVNDSDCLDEPPEVSVVFFWEYSIKNTWAFTIDIIKELPSLVSAQNLWISGCTAK